MMYWHGGNERENINFQIFMFWWTYCLCYYCTNEKILSKWYRNFHVQDFKANFKEYVTMMTFKCWSQDE